MKLYSRSCTYTIRALAEMASRPQSGRFRAADVCQAAGIPESYTRKTFQTLVQAGFLEASTGPGGGYRMTSNPTLITLRHIVEAVDGTEEMKECVLGHGLCDSRHPCTLHPMWRALKTQMLTELENISVHDAGKAISQARVGTPTNRGDRKQVLKQTERGTAGISRRTRTTKPKKEGRT